MDTAISGREHGPDASSRIRLLASLAPRFGILWQWLAGLVKLTEEEKEDAGI